MTRKGTRIPVFSDESKSNDSEGGLFFVLTCALVGAWCNGSIGSCQVPGAGSIPAASIRKDSGAVQKQE